MSPAEVIKFAEEYLSAYLSNFVIALYRPWDNFPIPSTASTSSLVDVIATRHAISTLNPKIVSFLIVNLFIGTSLLGITFSFTADFLTVCATSIFLWFIFSAVLYLFAKIVGGRARFPEAISIGMQLFAVIYVIASFCTILWASVVSLLQLKDHFNEIIVISKPIYMYFGIQTALLTFYVPYLYKRVHRLNYMAAVTMGLVVSALLVIVNILIFASAGEIHRIPPAIAR